MLKKFNEMLGLGSGVIILIVSFLIVFEIIARWVFGSPTIWALPVSQHLILVMVFLGTAFCFQEDGHVNVEVFVDRIRPVFKKYLIVLGYLLSLVYVAVLLWYSFKLTSLSITMGWTTIGSFPIPTSILYTIMVLGSVVLIVTILRKTWLALVNSDKKES